MKGSTDSVTAVAGNQVDYTITAISNALPLIQSGKVKPLASTGPRRHELLPSIPTMTEAVPPGFVYETWQALFSPANVPRSVLEQLNREVLRILAEADTREFFARYGSAPRPRTLQASGEFVKSEARTAIDLVKAIGATAQ